MQLTTTLGEKVVSKTSAETLGTVDGVVVDVSDRRLKAVRLGKGRKAKLISWDALSGVGSAAVIVEGDDALRDPAEPEQRQASGDVAVIGALVLSDAGNAQGTVVDVEFEADTGALVAIHTTHGPHVSAERLLAVGPYAWIVAEPEATAAT